MSGFDITRKAVVDQSMAMREPNFDIGIKFSDGKVRRRGRWSIEFLTAKKTIAYLRHCNAKGAHIYIRPAVYKNRSGQPLYPAVFLLDDLDNSGLVRLKRRDIPAAAVIQTSPNNFQAWIALGSNNYSHSQSLLIARQLCDFVGGDRGAAQPGQYGRLAGFVNNKPKHRDPVTELNPFVICHQSSGVVWEDGKALLDLAGAPEQKANPLSVSALRAKQRANIGSHARFADRGDDHPDAAVGFYLKNMRQLKVKYGAHFDPSRGEWMTIISMLQKSHTPLNIANAMITASFSDIESILDRKGRFAGDYIHRTIAKAQRELTDAGVNAPPLCQRYFTLIETLSSS